MLVSPVSFLQFKHQFQVSYENKYSSSCFTVQDSETFNFVLRTLLHCNLINSISYIFLTLIHQGLFFWNNLLHKSTIVYTHNFAFCKNAATLIPVYFCKCFHSIWQVNLLLHRLRLQFRLFKIHNQQVSHFHSGSGIWFNFEQNRSLSRLWRVRLNVSGAGS